MAAIEQVIFDLGGVLIDWNPRYLFRKLIPDDAHREWFLGEVCSPAWNALHDAGQPFAVGIAELTERFPEQGPLIRAYFSRWPEMLGGAIEGTVALLEEVHARGIPVYALTNWSAETFPFARRRFAFLDEFDDILVSGEEGMAKPDPAIFERAAARFSVAPQRTLFIDDARPNVAAARDSGFRVHHFRAPQGLAEALKTQL